MGSLSIKSHDTLIVWSRKITWQTKIIWALGGHSRTWGTWALGLLKHSGTLFGRLISNVLWGPVLIMDILSTIKYNISFPHNLEFIQRNSAKVITTAIRGKSREKICNELGFEFLKSRRKCRELCCFYKVFKLQSLGYLFDKPKEAILQKKQW